MPSASHTPGPLRTIVSRPSQLLEKLECGHTINRPLGLGENAQLPSKVKRRRCPLCATSVVNIPWRPSETCTQTSDDLAFECEQIAEQAEATAAKAVTLVSGSRAGASSEVSTLADLIVETNRLIASTNRNMARMMNRG